MEVERLGSAEDVARRCAAVLAAEVLAGARHVGLTGGTSPVRAYELLGPMVPDWSDVHLWYADERCVPPDHEDSNHGQVAARLEAPGATWHRMQGELGPDQGADAYTAEMAATELDVLLLGLGPDGHCASLFPDHPALRAGGVAVGVHDSPKPPPERISLTLPTINAAGRLVLLATGEGKREALARVLSGERSDATPASLLAREKLLVLADPGALPE